MALRVHVTGPEFRPSRGASNDLFHVEEAAAAGEVGCSTLLLKPAGQLCVQCVCSRLQESSRLLESSGGLPSAGGHLEVLQQTCSMVIKMCSCTDLFHVEGAAAAGEVGCCDLPGWQYAQMPLSAPASPSLSASASCICNYIFIFIRICV